MPVGRRPLSVETTSLLEDGPPSYRSVDDVSNAPHSPDEPSQSPVTNINVFSRTDLIWMLAGLWSGVLLGAFDGMLSTNLFEHVQLISRPGTVVATLLTPIGSEFGASNQASYIGTSYLLSVCCFTPLYGRSLSWIVPTYSNLEFRSFGRYPWEERRDASGPVPLWYFAVLFTWCRRHITLSAP